jgi:hypothetical protein
MSIDAVATLDAPVVRTRTRKPKVQSVEVQTTPPTPKTEKEMKAIYNTAWIALTSAVLTVNQRAIAYGKVLLEIKENGWMSETTSPPYHLKFKSDVDLFSHIRRLWGCPLSNGTLNNYLKVAENWETLVKAYGTEAEVMNEQLTELYRFVGTVKEKKKKETPANTVPPVVPPTVPANTVPPVPPEVPKNRFEVLHKAISEARETLADIWEDLNTADETISQEQSAALRSEFKELAAELLKMML